jgi:hypothetical protein
MITLTQLITEHFDTIFPEDEAKRMKISKQVWDLIEKAYSYIGGLAGCKDYDTFVKMFVKENTEKQYIWKVVRRGKEVTAIKIYSTTKGGRKSAAMACADTEQGQKDLNKILEEDIKIKERGNWAEVSGRALGKYLNKGAVVLPNTMAKELMPEKRDIELLPDGYFYKRNIKGELHTKMLVGYPPNGFVGDKPTDELVKQLKELGKKYESGE